MAVCSKCRTRYALAYSTKCERCKKKEEEESRSRDIVDVAADIAVGYVIGSALSNLFDSSSSDSSSSSSDYSSSSSDWSGGGGDTGGGGAGGDW